MTKAETITAAWNALQAANAALTTAQAAVAQAEQDYTNALNMTEDEPPPPPRRTFDVSQSSDLGPWYAGNGYPATSHRWAILTTTGALVYGGINDHLTTLLEAVFGSGQTEGVQVSTPGEISFNAATQVAQIGVQHGGTTTLIS